MTFSKFHLQDGQESQRNQSFYGITGFYRKFWKSSAFYGHGQVSHTRKRGQTITNQSHKMLLETGGQNSHWGYHVPSMMNVLDFEVLNGSPGDKQTNKRLWKEVYQAANGMKSLKEKKQQNWTRGDSDKSQRYGTTLEVTRCVCAQARAFMSTWPWPQKHQAQSLPLIILSTYPSQLYSMASSQLD